MFRTSVSDIVAGGCTAHYRLQNNGTVKPRHTAATPASLRTGWRLRAQGAHEMVRPPAADFGFSLSIVKTGMSVVGGSGPSR